MALFYSYKFTFFYALRKYYYLTTIYHHSGEVIMSDLDLNNSSHQKPANQKSVSGGSSPDFKKLNTPNLGESLSLNNLDNYEIDKIKALPSYESQIRKSKEDVKTLQDMLKKLSSSGFGIASPGTIDGILAETIDSPTSKDQIAFLSKLLKENGGSLSSLDEVEIEHLVNKGYISRTQHSLLTLQKAYNKEFGKEEGYIAEDARFGKQSKDALVRFFKEKNAALNGVNALGQEVSFVEVKVVNSTQEYIKTNLTAGLNKGGVPVDTSALFKEPLKLQAPVSLKEKNPNSLNKLGTPVDISGLLKTPTISSVPKENIELKEPSQPTKLIDIYNSLDNDSYKKLTLGESRGLLDFLPEKVSDYQDYSQKDIAVIQGTYRHLAPPSTLNPVEVTGLLTDSDAKLDQMKELSDLLSDYNNDLSSLDIKELEMYSFSGRLSKTIVSTISFQKDFNENYAERLGAKKILVNGILGDETISAMKLRLGKS